MAFALQTTAARSAGSPGVRTDNRVDINNHLEAAPLLWLGYIGDSGLGGPARWWYFPQGSNQAVAIPSGEGANSTLVFSAAPLGLSLGSAQAMAVTSKLELNVADLEAVQDFRAV